MFKRPEEILVLILAICWLVCTYFLAAYLGADAYTVLTITGLTLLWAAASFKLWQRNLSRHIWPLFLGFLVACWWPYLDWLAVKDIAVSDSGSQAVLIAKPWYASWTFKIILALIPTAAAYAFKWKQSKKRRTTL